MRLLLLGVERVRTAAVDADTVRLDEAAAEVEPDDRLVVSVPLDRHVGRAERGDVGRDQRRARDADASLGIEFAVDAGRVLLLGPGRIT